MDDDNFMRRWSTDAEGRRVMVGLSFDETEEWHRLANGGRASATEADGERYFVLFRRHEQARFEVLAAENQQRVDRPTNH